jgi:hypothetical protein
VRHERVDQLLAVGEVVVEGAVRDAGATGEVGDVEALTLFGQHLERRVEQHLSGARLLLVTAGERELGRAVRRWRPWPWARTAS